MPSDIPTTVFRGWGERNDFVRKGTTLYRDQGETIAVVNLQGSRYGGRYFLNVALWLKPLGEERYPKEHACHLRTRVAELHQPPADESDEDYLDSTSDLSAQERADKFQRVLDEVVAPALTATHTLADLRSSPELVARFLVCGDAGDLLGLPGLGE